MSDLSIVILFSHPTYVQEMHGWARKHPEPYDYELGMKL